MINKKRGERDLHLKFGSVNLQAWSMTWINCGIKIEKNIPKLLFYEIKNISLTPSIWLWWIYQRFFNPRFLGFGFRGFGFCDLRRPHKPRLKNRRSFGSPLHKPRVKNRGLKKPRLWYNQSKPSFYAKTEANLRFYLRFNDKTEANLRFLHSVFLPSFLEAVLEAVRPKNDVVFLKPNHSYKTEGSFFFLWYIHRPPKIASAFLDKASRGHQKKCNVT